MTLTKEWLRKTIAELEEERDAVPGAVNEDAAKALAAMKLALASLEAEPAIHRWRRVTVEPYGPYPWHYGNFIGFSKPVEGIEDEYYYSATPAPVSVKDHQIRELVNELRDIAVEYHGTQQLRERIARTVRAAMLQGADGNSPVMPDGWVACSERMPDKGQNVLISVNFDSPLIEPLICSARYTGSTFRRGDVTVKPGEGVEEVTHWMPLPAAPQQEVKNG
ncbi:DUF551 domain-containing protein [Enterobacter cancerogenus]|uniref:DUF551 domain-containing protein n=1 Tax=Enterobacter cancerogenus TaxID=69218 RepID=UPI0036F31CA9